MNSSPVKRSISSLALIVMFFLVVVGTVSADCPTKCVGAKDSCINELDCYACGGHYIDLCPPAATNTPKPAPPTNTPKPKPTNTPRPGVPTSTPKPLVPTDTPLPPTSVPTSPPDKGSCPNGSDYTNPDGTLHCIGGGDYQACVYGTCHVLTSTSGCGAGDYLKLCTGGASGYVCQSDLSKAICLGGNYCDAYTHNNRSVPYINTDININNTKNVKGKPVADPQGTVTWGEVPDVPQYRVEIYDLTNPALTVSGFPTVHDTWVEHKRKDGQKYRSKDPLQEKWTVAVDSFYDPVSKINVRAAHSYKIVVTAIDTCGATDAPPTTTTTLKSFIQGNVYNCPAGTQVNVSGNGLGPFTYPVGADVEANPAFYSTGATTTLAGGSTYRVALENHNGYNVESSQCDNVCTNPPLAASGSIMNITLPTTPAVGSSNSYVNLFWRCVPVPPDSTSTPTATPGGPPPAGLAIGLEIGSPTITSYNPGAVMVYTISLPLTIKNTDATELSSQVTLVSPGSFGVQGVPAPAIPVAIPGGASYTIPNVKLTTSVAAGTSGPYTATFRATGQAVGGGTVSRDATFSRLLSGPAFQSWATLINASYFHPAALSTLHNPIATVHDDFVNAGLTVPYELQFMSDKQGLSTVEAGYGRISFTPKTPEESLGSWKDSYTHPSADHSVKDYLRKLRASNRLHAPVNSPADITESGIYDFKAAPLIVNGFNKRDLNVVIVTDGSVAIRSSDPVFSGFLGHPTSSLAIISSDTITIDDTVSRIYGLLRSTNITFKTPPTNKNLYVIGNLISETGWSAIPRIPTSNAPTILIRFEPSMLLKLAPYLGEASVENP